MAASSSSNSRNLNAAQPWKYHVFLSFRGEDTRYNFTDHLYAAVWRKGIITFRDDEELEKGEVIKDELLRAIDESLCTVVILSQNYASSTWCLDELQKVLESRETLGRGVLPVFYGIDPSSVRHQMGNFAEAFRRHEERFGKDNSRVKSWREALSKVANMSGYHSKNRPESELIEEIITALWTKLEPNLPRFIDDEFVGIERKIEEICEKLEIGSTEVHFVGIWGMGGIGKTTLARIVFNQFRGHFDISCCLENVREKCSVVDGLLGLQMKLLSRLEIGDLEIDNLNQGQAILRALLPQRKVLLLLDDVDDIRQLEHLAGKRDWFGQGSKIIITTRNMHVLESHDATKYEIEVLSDEESLELFCHKAFKRNQPKEGYEKLSQILVQYCQGLPLALRVLGSHFYGRGLTLWEDSIKKIRKDPPKDILDTLRISYEGLDDSEKNIFLDIACHFKGWPEGRVIQIWEDCDLCHKIGIQILIERSLLTCQYDFLNMHDLLQQMGRKIVVEKSNNEISKQSRLWSPIDIDDVLKKNKGTEFIQSIVLQERNYDGRWDPEAFSKMLSLRILIIRHGLSLPFGLKCLPDSLKVIEWNEFPLKFLPSCAELNKLVELKMCHSKIKQLWSGIQNFKNLKFIDLSYAKDLIRTPNFFGAPNLERLVLKGCSNLTQIHESVVQLKKLVILNLKDCINIKYLPSKLETKSLKDLILCGCSKLKKLPEFDADMEGISKLDLRGCKNLDCLPNSIWNSKHLEELDISGCSKLIKLPEIMNANESLKRLDMGETGIHEVPSFLSRFQNLERLSVRGCRGPISNLWWKLWGNFGLTELKLPPLSSFPMLRELDASYCNFKDGSIPDDLSCLSSLIKLNLSGNNFVTLPPRCMSKLQLLELGINDCPKLQMLPMFPPSLTYVTATSCGSTELHPDTMIRKLLSNMFDKVDPEGMSIFLTMSGNEIPTWFDKQENAIPDKSFRYSEISIKIDIPHCCRSSEWWGIVFCVLVENTTSVHPKGNRPVQRQWDVFFTLEDPKDGSRIVHCLGHTCQLLDNWGLNQPHLLILSSCLSEATWKAVRDSHDQVNLKFDCVLWMLDDSVSEDDKYHGRTWREERFKANRYGWRVICNNEVWRQASINDCENLLSDSSHSGGFN